MRAVPLLVCILLCHCAAHAAPPPEASDAAGPGTTFAIGLSPFLDASVKDAVYREAVRMVVEELPLDSTLEVYDAFNLRSVARIAIPNSKVFNSPKTRANQFASAIGEIRQFLARENARPGGAKSNFDSAVRLPQFCDFLAQTRPGAERKIPLLLIGSPIYDDVREPQFSMAAGYYPSDAHLRASRAESIFGFDAAARSEPALEVYWSYFGDPWISDLHRERVTRFWALYLERRAGRLASFSSDLETAARAFCARTDGADAASNGWAPDPQQTKLEMVRSSRTVQAVDWLTGDSSGQDNPPPPSRMTGPLKIGIRWKDNIDLDLYARPRPGAERLFFQHPHSAEGYYFKDHRSSPGREYEYIEFETPVDIRDAQASVNFYAGFCPGGPTGEVRIEFLDRIYRGSFSIESDEGNQGRGGRSQAKFWSDIPIQQILGVSESRPLSELGSYH